MKRVSAYLPAIVGLVALAGCGVKSAPQPPVIRVADPTRDLSVFQADRSAVLTWSYPSSTTSGESLHDLESIEVWRATLLEVEAPPPGEKTRDRNLNRQLLLSTGELIAELDRPALDAATRGAELEWRDDLERWWTDHPSDEQQMIWYAVRSVCCRGRESGLSNIARLVPIEPPAPPTELEVAAEAEGIRLTWVPSEEHPVLVERSADGERWTAVTNKGLSTGEWLDIGAAQGGSWNYRLRSMISRKGQPRVVGEPGPVVGVFYPDIYPPAAPADLVCLPEGVTVRLRWRAAEQADHHRVYRISEDRTRVLLAEGVTQTQFEDVAPPPGMSTYEVTTVDPDGNESEASSCTAARGSR